MIDPPKRTGYRLTYDAECLYNDWQEIGGCSCHTGCAPCSSCTHDGNPISLEENDEAWEKDTVGELVKVRVNPKYFHEIVRYIPYSHGDPIGRWSIFEAREYFDGWLLHGKVFHKKVFDIVEEETEMSRSSITDKGSGMQPPLPQEFKVGKYYKCVEDRKDLRKGDLYKVVGIVSSVGQPILKLVNLKGSYLQGYGDWFDVNSESDYDPNTAQPAGYTAYVVFKQESTGFGRNTYNGKEYAYKCSREDYTQWVEYRAFDEDVFAEVNVNGVEKKVKVVRIEVKVDPKATKSIARILPKELAKDVEGSKLGTPKAILEAVNFVHDFKPNDFSITKEEIDMSTTQRKVVEVQLFDDAKGLPVQDSLVAKFDNVLTEDDNDTTIREVIMNNDLKATLKAHNAKRAKVTNLDILERTGNSVPLQPILLKDLRWKVIG